MATQADREIVSDYVKMAESFQALKLVNRIIDEAEITPNYDDFKAKLAQIRKDIMEM